MKAVELDPTTRQRTGRAVQLQATTRSEAVAELLGVLGVSAEAARVDPSRTLVEVPGQLWTLIATPPPEPPVSPGLRRAGAKHRRVR